jgi:hypothetical protein
VVGAPDRDDRRVWRGIANESLGPDHRQLRHALRRRLRDHLHRGNHIDFCRAGSRRAGIAEDQAEQRIEARLDVIEDRLGRLEDLLRKLTAA